MKIIALVFILYNKIKGRLLLTMKILKVSISNQQIRVKNGKDLLLITSNNINAYTKLWNALQGQEADEYILIHWGRNIACTNDKEKFTIILNKWFEN